ATIVRAPSLRVLDHPHRSESYGFSRARARRAPADVSPVEAEEHRRRHEMVCARTAVGIAARSGDRAAHAEGAARKARPRLAAWRRPPRSPRPLQEAFATGERQARALAPPREAGRPVLV